MDAERAAPVLNGTLFTNHPLLSCRNTTKNGKNRNFFKRLLTNSGIVHIIIQKVILPCCPNDWQYSHLRCNLYPAAGILCCPFSRCPAHRLPNALVPFQVPSFGYPTVARPHTTIPKKWRTDQRPRRPSRSILEKRLAFPPTESFAAQDCTPSPPGGSAVRQTWRQRQAAVRIIPLRSTNRRFFLGQFIIIQKRGNIKCTKTRL